MVRILSQNVCGLCNTVKRREAFMLFKQKADIVCLQETHSTPEDECFWRNEWRGKVYFSHGCNDARGVLIAIQENADLEVIDSQIDSTGRYVMLQIKHLEELFVLCSVYAPNKDSPEFFLNIFKVAENFTGKCISVGDFNFAFDPTLDRKTNKKLICNNDKSKDTVTQFMEDTLMVDIWGVRNPIKRTFTYQCNKGKVASRIDLALIDQCMEGWVTHIST